MTPWLIGAGILFALIILFAVTINSTGGGGTLSTVEAPDVPPEWIDGRVLGNPEAKVTVEAWEDFLCPACGQWNQSIEPQLFEEFIKTGQVKLSFHHFPLQAHSPGAQFGAMASECAADQGAFWPYHNRLFAVAAGSGQAGFQVDRLIRYAADLELDDGRFRECITTQEHRAEIDMSVTQAIDKKLASTPSILVNDQLLSDPFSYDELKAEIERQLEAAGS